MAKSMHDTPFETVRLGVVSSVDLKKGTARVVFEDRSDVVSPELAVMQKNTMNSKFYWMPDVNETVVCLYLANGQETGIIIGSVYSDADKPVPEISEEGKKRLGIWIDDNNYIKWVEEERRFVVKTENPIDWMVG